VIFNIEDEKLTEAWHIPYDLYQWDEFFE